jgi:hypothetical protein
MVHDDLWVWHIPGPNVLCLRCAEKRLGRAFVASDFRADLPVNAWIVDAFSCGIDPATVHGESPIKSHHDAVRKACVRFPVGGQTSTLNKIRSIQPLKLAGTDTVY